MSSIDRWRRAARRLVLAVLAGLFWTGCRVAPGAKEDDERRRVETAERTLYPDGGSPELPVLGPESSLDEVARYAVLRSPLVAERFWSWKRAVEEIVVARSPEDPSLELELEIERTLEVFAPGVFGEFPGPGKRALMAEAQAYVAGALRHDFEEAALQTAVRARLAWLRMSWLTDLIEVQGGVLDILRGIDDLASAQFRVGRVSQQDLLRVEIERDELETEIVSLQDARGRVSSELRAALGIPLSEPDPPWPARWNAPPALAPEGDLLELAIERNHRLAALQEAIGEAEALVALARKSNQPDFMGGLGVDLAGPVTLMPELGATLPIWRDKIAANVAAALAREHASDAAWSSAVLELASALADAHYRYRDAARRLALLENQLLPKAALALEAARAAYPTGLTDMTGLLDAERTLFEFRVQEVNLRLEREVALAELGVLLASSAAVSWEPEPSSEPR